LFAELFAVVLVPQNPSPSFLLQVGYRRDQYKRCANLLEAVSQLLEYFAHYQDVPKIHSLTKRLTTVQVGAKAGR
jgi:hypothetical protein